MSTTTTSTTRPPTNRNRGTCRFYNKPGGCFADERCKFMHVTPGCLERGAPESLLISPYDANKICRFFQQGHCRHGAACWFKHVLSGDGPVSPAAKPLVQGTISATVADDDDGEVLCAVCYEVPSEFGLLDSCNHAFCRTCIRDWRGQQGKSIDILISQTNKTCPSCRTRSRFVIPSSRFPSTPAEKEKMVDNYKRSMSRVDCRYFLASRERGEHPFCPYGLDCFYRHLNTDGTPCVFVQGVDELMVRFKRDLQRRATSSQARPRPAAPTINFETIAEDFLASLRRIADSLLAHVPADGEGGRSAGYRIGEGIVRMSENQVQVLEDLFSSVGARTMNAITRQSAPNTTPTMFLAATPQVFQRALTLPRPSLASSGLLPRPISSVLPATATGRTLRNGISMAQGPFGAVFHIPMNASLFGAPGSVPSSAVVGSTRLPRQAADPWETEEEFDPAILEQLENALRVFDSTNSSDEAQSHAQPQGHSVGVDVPSSELNPEVAAGGGQSGSARDGERNGSHQDLD
ncbi:hypothetical protein BKA62DRAFT_725722 [Auriculariales sp. MPI-PUGE-AT-0066]|nr:hypothetical protein BKA62DRAFT_725722 [Auriculariales sp. MPI-PUGE-AT-0066]